MVLILLFFFYLKYKFQIQTNGFTKNMEEKENGKRNDRRWSNKRKVELLVLPKNNCSIDWTTNTQKEIGVVQLIEQQLFNWFNNNYSID